MEEFRPVIADSVVLTLANNEMLTPDDFLTHQWHLDRPLVIAKIRAQCAGCNKNMSGLLDLLAKMVPEFTRLVRSSLEPQDL